jgi:hypothetical protein
MRFAVAAMLIIAMAFFLPTPKARAAPATGRALYPQHAIRPRLAPTATSFVAIPFPSPHPFAVGNVVFLPSGTAYFTDAKNELASFTPGGVYTRIPVPHAVLSYTLLYARGVFWMIADQGIVKVAPDGSSRRWYPLTAPGEKVAYVQSMAAGPGGVIYALGAVAANGDEIPTSTLFRIGTNGVVTTTPLSVMPAGNGTEVFGSDNLLYFGYVGPAGSSGIARLESDGSLSLFPIAGASQIGSFVLSRGDIYFDYSYYDSATLYYTGQLGRFTPAGAITMISLPSTGPSTSPSQLAVDKGGNIWLDVDNPYGINQYFMYQFNVYTGHFNGPYLTGLPNLFYNGPAVAPNDNVWIVLPASSGVDDFQPIGFGIFERGA